MSEVSLETEPDCYRQKPALRLLGKNDKKTVRSVSEFLATSRFHLVFQMILNIRFLCPHYLEYLK